jgi:RNA polymerase sigma factor (sigma-70 family)
MTIMTFRRSSTDRPRRELLRPQLDRIADHQALWCDGTESPAEDLDARDQRIRRAVAEALTERQREVIELHYFQGLSQGEIAKSLGVSQQVVHKTIHGVQRSGRSIGGALRKLREVLAEEIQR